MDVTSVIQLKVNNLWYLVIFWVLLIPLGWGGFAYVLAQEEIAIAKIRVVSVLKSNDTGQPLSFPSTLAYDRQTDELYVLDAAKGRIIIYSPDLFPIFSFGIGREVENPSCIAIDKEGLIYIGESPKGNKPAKIAIFNQAAIKIKEFYFKDFEGASNFIPRSLAIGFRGRIYVAGSDFRGVVVLDREGHFIKLLAPEDTFAANIPKRKAQISDVYIDENGRIYLASEEMGRIYVYDRQERYLFKLGQKGGTFGKLSRPRGVAADPRQDLIYVVDYMRHTGQAYDYQTGKFRFEFGGRGWSPGWFNYPTDIVVDKFSRLYIADLFNHRVQVIEFASITYPEIPVEVPSFITPIQKIKIPKK